jgi:hypothetical protein
MSEPAPIGAAPGVHGYVVARAAAILAAERVWDLLPECGEVRARAEAMVPAGVTLAAAHETWLAGYLAVLPGLGPLQRQPADARTPAGVVRVVIECVAAPSGGMSSHFGFRGTFVSLLVAVPLGCVWDARCEGVS